MIYDDKNQEYLRSKDCTSVQTENEEVDELTIGNDKMSIICVSLTFYNCTSNSNWFSYFEWN